MHSCTACPVGMYKLGVSNETRCMTCPVNSTANKVGSTVCECVYGTVRNLSRPQDACQDLESFIRQSKSKNSIIIFYFFFWFFF